MIIVLLIAFGLIFGSFVNALVWRLHGQQEIIDKLDQIQDSIRSNDSKAAKTDNSFKATATAHKAADKKVQKLTAELETLSMSKGRSMCSSCRHPLAAKDLIPLFSWVWLRGKCRYCHKPIEDTPLLEAGLPIAFVLSYVFWPFDLHHYGYGTVAFGLWLLFLIGFATLSAYDIRWFLLPDKVVWPLASLALVQVMLHATIFHGGLVTLISAFWGVAICSGIFYALFMVSNGEWIGGGDVKLGIVLGLLVGGPLPGLLLIFTASLLGTLASLPMLVQKKLKRTSIIPFGPFLMLAAALVLLFGQHLINSFNAFVLL